MVPGLLGEMVDCRDRAGEVQDECVIPCSARGQRDVQKKDRGISKGYRSQPERAPMAKFGMV